jgi:hypothetical protein
MFRKTVEEKSDGGSECVSAIVGRGEQVTNHLLFSGVHPIHCRYEGVFQRGKLRRNCEIDTD